MAVPDQPAADASVATHVAKLWPNREHESSPVLGHLCRLGIHRWRQLDLTTLAPGKDIHFCFWCTKIKIGATIYDP